VELNELDAEAFETRVFDETEWKWIDQVRRYSLGGSSQAGDHLIGFAKVLCDGLVHAWLQDTMVAKRARHQGIGTTLVAMTVDQARYAGCGWLHVDFEGPSTSLLASTPAGSDRPTPGSSPCRPPPSPCTGRRATSLPAVRAFENVADG
jgi:GNAT superfamily N-acetyltransferase